MGSTPPQNECSAPLCATDPARREGRRTTLKGMAPQLSEAAAPRCSGKVPSVRPAVLHMRAYGPDSTPSEVAAIRERIYMVRDDVLMFRELTHPTAFTVDVTFDRIAEVTRSLERFSMLADVTEATRPTAEVRAHLRRRFARERMRLGHVAVFTGHNFLLNISAQFVLSGHNLPSFSVHKTMEQAMEAIRRHASEQR